MKCSTKYVGLDVHQSTTLATVRQSSGKTIARSILPTEEAALLEFFAGMRGAVHVAFEEGTQAQWLHDLLSPRVARVIVCDRRGTPRQGNKGDPGGLRHPRGPAPLRPVAGGLPRQLGPAGAQGTHAHLPEPSARRRLRLHRRPPGRHHEAMRSGSAASTCPVTPLPATSRPPHPAPPESNSGSPPEALPYRRNCFGLAGVNLQ
jgi:hypothetical protein